MQVASVTGLYGLTFLMAWFASVVNWAWENALAWPQVRRGVLSCTVVLVAVPALGSVRLMVTPPGPTVRIASLTHADIPRFPTPDIERRAYTAQLTPDERQQVRERSRLIDEDLLQRAARQADAGARIVFWGEGNSYVLPEDEGWLIDQAAQLARDKQIYLGLGNVVWHYGARKPLENGFVLFDPKGSVAWKFLKARPVPGFEAPLAVTDGSKLKFAETPFGRLTGVICFDADFVQLVRQAGAGHADLMLIPSNDWSAIDPWHTQMAVFRAVEQGANLVRHTSSGLSVAVDYQGRVRGAMDHYQTSGDRVLVADVPTRGALTIYARIGDLFSWLALAGLFGLSARSRLSRRRT